MSDAVALSDHVCNEIDSWTARFPADRKRSAVLAALHAVQHENDGYLTAELMNCVAEYLDLPTIQVYEVATFYSMFQTRPVGRHNVAICTNVSCMLRGADEIVDLVSLQSENEGSVVVIEVLQNLEDWSQVDGSPWETQSGYLLMRTEPADQVVATMNDQRMRAPTGPIPP